MPTLFRLLVDYEADLLEVIASYWDVDLAPDEHIARAEQLASSILAADIKNTIWQRLTREEKQALLDLQAQDGQLTVAQFGRQYGELRPMGLARRERERPWVNPANVTEALYYRGLIARVFVRGAGGAQAVIAIPDELQQKLPEPEKSPQTPGYGIYPVDLPYKPLFVGPEDIATMLAHQLTFGPSIAAWLDAFEPAPIDEYLRLPYHRTYRALLTALATETGLLSEALEVNKDRARPWLEAPRNHQIRALAQAWQRTTHWNDLAHVPGLRAEVWPNNILLARKTVLNALQSVPEGVYWHIPSFIDHIKQTSPDFQRPGGDYTTWYIHNAHQGNVLVGFDHWDEIEGALIRFILEGAMHLLGLVWAPSTQLDVFKLTPYGAALVGQRSWPSAPDPTTQIEVSNTGEVRISTEMSLYHRLQIARFSDWVEHPSIDTGRINPAYVYQLSAASLRRAANQQISGSNIAAFLQKYCISDVSTNIVKALERYQARPNAVTLRDLVIVTASSREVYDTLRSNPSLQGLIEQRAGEFGFAVRRDNLPALRRLLWEIGVIPNDDQIVE